METCIRMIHEVKMKKLLQTIEKLIESTFIKNNRAYLTSEKIEGIIQKQNLFQNIDLEKISSFNKSYIKIDEFNNTKKYYEIIYVFFLNKIYKLKNKNADLIVLFNTFNQVYYYKKHIKYVTQLITKYPKLLEDDLLKEKFYEIVHSLESSDKLYIQDFYFYISMYNIHHYYKKYDISIPEFEMFDDINIDNSNIESNLDEIKSEKKATIRDLISYIKCVNSKSKVIEMLSSILDEIENSNLFKNKDFENIIRDGLITEKEKKFIDYLKNNKTDADLIKVDTTFLKYDQDLKDKIQYYYKDEMDSFLSLSKEDKYIILNSCDFNVKFRVKTENYRALKNSYDEGMKEENCLKEKIKDIIEDKEFFNFIKDILNSGKVLDYCSNPIQYIKDKNNKIRIYDEKKGEEENLNQKISKFKIKSTKNEIEEGENFLYSILKKECEKVEEIHDKCQFQLDYEYFVNNVFNEDFFKDRIIYSFLPRSIKACVNSTPKIILNVCGNHIISYKNDINSEDYITLLKALYTVILIHEIIHLIRRENPKDVFTKEYTPKPDNYDYEGGRSFIYHIFGNFVIIYIDLPFAEKILTKKSWEKDSKELKNQLERIENKNEDEIINAMIKQGGIKCYDSTNESEDQEIEMLDFCCRLNP